MRTRSLAGLAIILVSMSVQATERVTLACRFDGVADGYVSKVYSENMVLESNRLYNSDGSQGTNQRAIWGHGSAGYIDFAFSLYDGQAYRDLYAVSGLKFNTAYHWSLNTGEITCALKHGWASSYYHDNTGVHDTLRIHDTISRVVPQYVYVTSVDTIYDTSGKYCRQVLREVHDTVVKLVPVSVLDSSKATQRFSMRGKYVGVALNEADCEFYSRFIKYNDSVFDENGTYVDSFDIKLVRQSGSYYKTIRLSRATLLNLVGSPALYPGPRGNFWITTERNWTQEPVKDWSLAPVSKVVSDEVERLRRELGK